MSGSSERAVSVEQFVSEIMEQYGTKTENGDFISYGYRAGWLEEQDVVGRTLPLERKIAARIIHQFMRLVLKEADVVDGGAASKLQDLYECRSCVGHVVQVYVKGIMEGHTDNTARFIFGMNEKVPFEEMQEIIDRLFNLERRKPQTQAYEVTGKVEVITVEEALQYLQTDKNAQLIDVRTFREFEVNHLAEAINIPLVSILKNPYAVSERRDVGILLYCREGYQSDIAARCLAEAGYEKVFCFAWHPQVAQKEIFEALEGIIRQII